MNFTTSSRTGFVGEVYQSAYYPQQEASGPDHWWKGLASDEVCSLSGFPLSLLPYPPFRFRVDPNDAENCKAVDAKFLVLQVIASGDFKACGRNLVDSDIVALDQHMRRCNLGRFRLTNLARLQKAVTDAQSAEERAVAERNLWSEQDNARKQLRKLQHIQSHRLKDLKAAKKMPKKKTKSQKSEAPASHEARSASTSQEQPLNIVLAKSMPMPMPMPMPDPHVIRWADASDEVVDMAACLLAPNSVLHASWLENLQRWRSSTESAKGVSDEIMSRRVENASWRLWASGADPSVCAPEFLLALDKKSHIPQIKFTSSSSHSKAIFDGRGRQPQDLQPMLKIEELCDDQPSNVLHNWRVSTKDQAKVVVLDGQARSRRENQLWRLMAISQREDPKSRAIVQKVCRLDPSLASQLGVPSGAQSSVTVPSVPLGGPLPVSRTTPKGNLAQPQITRADSSTIATPKNLTGIAHTPSSIASPKNCNVGTGRNWLRTPSPEFRPWMPTARPMPVLAPPPVTASPAQNQGWYMHMQPTGTAQNQGYYMQPQVVGLMPGAPFQSGVCMQPVATMPTMAVSMMTTGANSSALPEDYVCVAVPKHLVPQIQEELTQAKHRSRN